jgi:hypothetical protein
MSDENWQGDNKDAEIKWKKVGHDLLKVAFLVLDNASYMYKSTVH